MTDSKTAGEVSVLESRFGHVLARIIPCWGDPEAFHEVFDDLIYDRRGDRGGWPFEAFMELELLQQVHQLAYGRFVTGIDVWDEVSERD